VTALPYHQEADRKGKTNMIEYAPDDTVLPVDTRVFLLVRLEDGFTEALIERIVARASERVKELEAERDVARDALAAERVVPGVTDLFEQVMRAEKAEAKAKYLQTLLDEHRKNA
jgi:hypothetical protein